MDLKELLAMTPAERARELAKAREELRAARFRVSLTQEKKVRLLRTLKKRIARILTAHAAQRSAVKNA